MKKSVIFLLCLLFLSFIPALSLFGDETGNVSTGLENPADIEKEFEKTERSISSLEKFIKQYPLHKMPIEFQQKVEDGFVNVMLSSDVKNRFVISDFAELAKKTFSEDKHGSVTMIGSGMPDIFESRLEYPKDTYPLDPGIPLGQGSVWRFKGKVVNLLGFTFEGNEEDPLRFVLIENHGLVFLYGSGKVISKDGTETVFNIGFTQINR